MTVKAPMRAVLVRVTTTVSWTTVVTILVPLAVAVAAKELVRNGRTSRVPVDEVDAESGALEEEVGAESGGLAVTVTVFMVVIAGAVTVTVTTSTPASGAAVATVVLDVAWTAALPWMAMAPPTGTRNCSVSWISTAASLRSWPLMKLTPFLLVPSPGTRMISMQLVYVSGLPAGTSGVVAVGQSQTQ